MAIHLASPDVRAKLEEAINEIFHAMIPVPFEHLDCVNAITQADSVEMFAILGFTGTKNGAFVIGTTRRGANEITAALLMLDSPDAIDADEAADAMGELVNMIGGNFKSYVTDAGERMELAAPAVVGGSDLRTIATQEAQDGITLFLKSAGEPLSLTYYVE